MDIIEGIGYVGSLDRIVFMGDLRKKWFSTDIDWYVVLVLRYDLYKVGEVLVGLLI